MSELYLVRHAQASFGADDYDHLSTLGIEQSRLLGRYFSGRQTRFDYLIAGQMQRHIETLDGVCEGSALSDSAAYRFHHGLNEYDFDGMVDSYRRLYPDDDLVRAARSHPAGKKEFYRLLRRVLSAWCENRLDAPIEAWTEFRQRVLDARTMVHGLAEENNRILIVSSGGAISLFIGSVLDLSPEKTFDLNMQIHNTSVSRFYFNHHKMSLASFNELPHLDHSRHADLITYG